jgi:hypothetical protein
VIIDKSGTFRMTATNTSDDLGSVYVLSSDDGLDWDAPEQVVEAEDGVQNWDPSLLQTRDGTFHLFFAPDLGDGPDTTQRIEHMTSDDFSDWSEADQITSPDGSWDYWPEADGKGKKQVTLYYTSEEGGSGADGTGHIWELEIK